MNPRGSAASRASALAQAALRSPWPLVLLALLERAAVFWLIPCFSPEPGYAGAANRVAEGVPLWRAILMTLGPQAGTLRPPSYPIYLAVLYKIFGAQGLWPAVGNHLLDIATLLLLYAIALRLWGRTAAFAAGLLYAADPSYPLFDSLGLSETLMAALVFAALYGFLKVMDDPRPRLGWSAAVGACAAAATLCRPGFALFGVVCVAFLLLPRRFGMTHRMKGACVAAVYFLIVGAWALRNQVYFGNLTLSSNFAASALGETYGLVDYQSPRYAQAKAALLMGRAEQEKGTVKDPAFFARKTLIRLDGMTEDQAAILLEKVWREAVWSHPRLFFDYVLSDMAFLYFPSHEKFMIDILQEFTQVYPDRWPRQVTARLRAMGFMDRVSVPIEAGWRLKRWVAWFALLGIACILYDCVWGAAPGTGSQSALFILANYACYVALFAIATAFSLYIFELEQFQILFAAAAVARIAAAGVIPCASTC